MPARSSSLRAVAVALLASACAAWAIWYWVAQGHPQPVAEGISERVQCVSYAPFRKPGESPFIEETVVTPERLAEDLKLLSARTGCVRTYSTQQGLSAVPGIAQSLGMKVLLGIWLGRDREKNEMELAAGIALANRFPETVTALIVGNEVLLRRELPVSVLSGYLDRARAATAVPVTYADVWEFWMENRALAQHVSFVTIHILPYWEDHPVAIDTAIEHIVATAETMRGLFDGKDILIGETGWPSDGRSRRAAVPSRVNQARFFRQFGVAAAEHRLRYNFIEAFDQPWKRRLEGAMGGQWGLFDSQGEPKFPATGPVAEDPDAEAGLIGAGAGFLLFGLVAAIRGTRRWALLTAAALGTVSGAVLVAQWKYMALWNRYPTEWLATGAYTALALAFAALASAAIAVRLVPGLQSPVAGLPVPAAAAAASTIPSLASVLADWRADGGMPSCLQWLGVLRFVFLFGAAAMTLLLVFDARYRGFPLPLYALPLLSLLLLLAAGFRTRTFGVEEAVLATIVLVCSIVFVPMERLSNLQALGFGAQAILFAEAATGFRYWRYRAWNWRRPDRADRAGA